MKIGVLGTGVVGRTLASGLVTLGHEVKLGSRVAGNEAAAEWVRSQDGEASAGTFEDAARHGDLVMNCTAGVHSLMALESAGAGNFDGKVLVDVSNPLDFSQGMPPSLSVCNTDSLGEQIQRSFPRARVVKALNTVNASVMTNPALIPGDHTLFMCGEDSAAKDQVRELLQGFGWKDQQVLDLGGISAARAMEMYLPLWLSLFGSYGTPMVSVQVHVARG